MTHPTIVVTGANGTIGSRVVAQLAQQEKDVVALVRDPSKAGALRATGARIAVGAFEDPGSLRAAFDGADTIVLITAPGPTAATQTESALAAAREAGVRKIVRISALKADPDGPTDNTRQHGRTEATLRGSGATYVILRPQFFFQNFLGSIGSIVGEGALRFATGAGRIGMIDTRDVADCAVIAATSADHDGETIELTGPATVDLPTVARAIGEALGREVTYADVTPQAFADALRAYGVDDWNASLLRDYCTAYARGFGDFTTDGVQRITGRPPRSLEDFVREVLVPAART